MTPEAIRAWRERARWSQEKAAQMLGCSTSHYRELERGLSFDGKRTVAPRRSERLAMAALALGLTDYHGPETALDALDAARQLSVRRKNV